MSASIIFRRSRPRLVTESGGGDAAQRRKIRPGAMQILKESNVDLIENLIARPVQFDHEVGDERAPVDAVEALAASISPAATAPPDATVSPASTRRPPACSITTGKAATSSAMVMGRVEKFIARQPRMGTAQSVPEHFSQRREPLAGKAVHADRRQLRHKVGNGEDLP